MLHKHVLAPDNLTKKTGNRAGQNKIFKQKKNKHNYTKKQVEIVNLSGSYMFYSRLSLLSYFAVCWYFLFLAVRRPKPQFYFFDYIFHFLYYFYNPWVNWMQLILLKIENKFCSNQFWNVWNCDLISKNFQGNWDFPFLYIFANVCTTVCICSWNWPCAFFVSWW